MNKALLITASVLALAPMSAAVAQDNSRNATLEEVVVTAQKRDERLQDVPVAITALTANALAAANASQGIDLAKAVPSLSLTQASGTITPFLRGIGNPSNGQAVEGSTAVYIDGIYYQRLSPLYFQLNNVERVEVLKGPQGTLFGRNAVGGVVHIITKDPGAEPVLHAQAGYGNYETVSGNFYGSTPIGDTLAADIAIGYNHQGKGWGRNVITGKEYGYDRSVTARAKLVWKPSDDTTAKIAVDYNRLRSTVGLAQLGYRGTTQGNLLPPFTLYRPEDIGFYDVRGNVDGIVGGEGQGITGTLRHDLGFATAVSLTNYNVAKDIMHFDGDNTPQAALEYNLPTHRKQFSQEFQLVSNPDSPFDWLLGAYHLDLTTQHRGATFAGLAFAPVYRQIYGTARTKSNAIFGQGTVHVQENTNLTVGLRYTRDKVRNYGQLNLVSLATNAIVTAGPFIDQSTTFEKVTYKAVLDHHFTSDVMGYISYSRGFKSGLYRITPVVAGPAARPEVLDAYELGLKSQLMDRRVILNVAAFYYDLKDPQVTRYPGGGGAPLYINAESGRTKGIEIDGQAAITSQLTARFGATFLRSKYRSFQGAPFLNVNPNPPYGNGATFPGDASGNYATRSPKFSGSVGFDYRIPVGEGEVRAGGNIYYNDGFYWDPDNRLTQKAYTLLDANLTWKPKTDGGLSVGVWAKNIGDEKYYLSENETAGANGSPSAPAAPRTFGVTVAFDY